MYGIFSRYIASDGGIGAYPNFLQVNIGYSTRARQFSDLLTEGVARGQ